MVIGTSEDSRAQYWVITKMLFHLCLFLFVHRDRKKTAPLNKML